MDGKLKLCPVCCGGKQEYQHTHSTKLFVDNFGQKRVLLVECNGCPPHSACALKDIPSCSAFIINFCPECGRDLRKGAEDGGEKDYISRAELIENLKRFAPEHYTDLIDQLICNQPAADVALVVHGDWIDRDEKTWCSVCHASNKQYKPPYCPHCGSIMDGGTHENYSNT